MRAIAIASSPTTLSTKVPRTPIVAVGVLSVTLVGLLPPMRPLMKRNAPLATVAAISPTPLSGS